MGPTRSEPSRTIADSRPTVIIAAHDEERVIGACLESLLSQGVRTDEIVVVANGCTDDTSRIARSYGVIVIDRPQPGKAEALNAGDAAARTSARIYLDADIVVPPGAVAALRTRLDIAGAPLAVVPQRRLALSGRPWPVRAYFAINEQLPAFASGLFGRGMIAVRPAGRARFGRFPSIVADDLFLDSQFDASEKEVVPDVEVVVEAPYTSRELLNRLARVRRGNADLRAASARGAMGAHVRPSDRSAWLRVALPQPRLWPAAAAYAALTLLAARRARLSSAVDWGRDAGSRNRAGMHSRERPA